MRQTRYTTRPAAAAVELAIVLPLLAFLFVIAVDYSRIFYYSLTVNNCARNGALYACDPHSYIKSPYGNITQAALADATNLNPTPTVTSAYGVDAGGTPYIDVTVTYPFQTITNFPGVPSATTLTRTVRMNIAPQTPS